MTMDEVTWTVGFHAVLGLLESGRPVDAVWVQRGKRDRRSARIMEAAKNRGLRVDLVPRQRLDGVAGTVPHNGFGARAAAVQYTAIEALIAPPELPARVVLLDHITDPHNLGAVIRSAVAFEVDGLVVAGPAAPPLAGAVAAASAGYLDRVPLARSRVAADAIALFREAGYWAYGAASDGRPAREVDPGERWLLCLGSEGRGLRAKTRTAIDELIAIPMAHDVESLNLSVSAGILLYEFCVRG
jgi:23S rRNA (guanosine2251-2'-O)-methyltransferase